jgi:hypothetical protein
VRSPASRTPFGRWARQCGLPRPVTRQLPADQNDPGDGIEGCRMGLG